MIGSLENNYPGGIYAMISSNKLVEACLCVYNHPAWITDSLGTVIAKNDAADHLNIEGLDLSQTIIKINKKIYTYSQKELNHGTNCYLNELEDEEQIQIRMQKSLDNLAEALDRRHRKSARF